LKCPYRAVTTIEADEVVASSDFLKQKKIPDVGSFNLKPAGSVLVFSSLQELRFRESLNLELSIEFSIISFIS
jgi:hypothetical protein